MKSAAPKEILPAPSPNPNKLVSTDKVAYCVWKDLLSTSLQDIVFARTNDRGKTWKVQTIHARPCTGGLVNGGARGEAR